MLTKETHQGFERFLQTASDRQLQIVLLELQTSLMTVFTEPDVIADAQQMVRGIRAELACRPTERFLREQLAASSR
jgi:hypothetical protein